MPLILEEQRHRGPDYQSELTLNEDDLTISLAHNRLAILDLQDRSNQPFVDLKSGACIVFNGEIYNYREIRGELAALGETFVTQGDTEVLLKAVLRWGPGVFQRLNGMFAFALWNPRTKSLMLARDRFGVKPCYYLNRSHQFAFASTPGSLARFFDAEVDASYLTRGILYNLYENEQGASPYQEIRAVPPGHYVDVRGTDIRIEKYYDLRESVERESARVRAMTPDQMQAEVEDRLRSAVELRLRSDVPVTISLSGGLDSGLIARFAMDRAQKPMDVFSFGSPEVPGSEARLAKLCAEAIGHRIHHVNIGDNELVEVFERTLHHQGAPFAHPSVMAQNQVFSAIHGAGYRVSLGGQGADEVFMGYRKFQFFHIKDLLRTGNYFGLPRAIAGLLAMMLADASTYYRLMHYRKRYFRRGPRMLPIKGAHSSEMIDMRMASYRDLQDRQLADVGFASLLTLLRYEDRNSMGHSVESRMPFLDYRVIELGSALPYQNKLRLGYGKWILRRIADRRLPREIAWKRSKKAFSLNESHWLKNGLGRHLESGIRQNLPRLRDVLSDNYIATLNDSASYLDPKNFPLMVTAYWLGPRL